MITDYVHKGGGGLLVRVGVQIGVCPPFCQVTGAAGELCDIMPLLLIPAKISHPHASRRDSSLSLYHSVATSVDQGMLQNPK